MVIISWCLPLIKRQESQPEFWKGRKRENGRYGIKLFRGLRTLAASSSSAWTIHYELQIRRVPRVESNLEAADEDRHTLVQLFDGSVWCNCLSVSGSGTIRSYRENGTHSALSSALPLSSLTVVALESEYFIAR